MFAGHVGVALAFGRAERRINVGVFMAAALLLDFLVWLFILFGWESVTIPADFSTTHQPAFVFPYSHGLLAAVGWSVVFGFLALLVYSGHQRDRLRTAAIVAAAVFSHWLLDAFVHRAEMPLAGPTSPMAGVGLWNNLPVALGIESALVVVGMYLFLPGSGLSRTKAVALGGLSVVILFFTIAGMTVAPAPPSAAAMAGSSLATIVAVCALGGWLGRLPRQLHHVHE